MKRIFIINQDAMGHGSHERGEESIGTFFLKLWPKNEKPDAIVFINSAVRMLTRGSMHLPGLMGLSDSGVELIASRESLVGFGLEAALLLGRAAEMDEIAELMMEAEQTITL